MEKGETKKEPKKGEQSLEMWWNFKSNKKKGKNLQATVNFLLKLDSMILEKYLNWQVF